MACIHCNQITETEYVELVAPTLFGDIGFEGSLCSDCKSIMKYCIYQYSILNDQLIEKMNKNALKLNLKTKRAMK